MASSLLAHLYSRIKGSQEDVATLSLQYIVSQSSALNHEFTRILCKALHSNIGSELNYVCQSVGENQERPDIAGIDTKGKENLLCEAKFYAGLTSNQPNAYLDRLKKNDGLGLVFICPSARKVTLWSKLLDLCKNRSVEKIDDLCVSVDGVRMSILSWSEIIESLRLVATFESQSSLQDIHQLDGFCKLMDDDAFVPFSAEDLGPINASREERHYQVLDAVFDRLITNKTLHASGKGLKATAYRDGYVRYVHVKDYSLAIRYDRQLWRSAGSEETPFWVNVKNADWKQTSKFLEVFGKYPERHKANLNGDLYLTLMPPFNAALDEVAEALVSQILQYIGDLDEALK